MSATVYLIPTVLADGKIECLPAYLLDAVKKTEIFFVENERTARRFLKLLWKEMVIDNYQWHTIKDVSHEVTNNFRQAIRNGKTIAILSEAGCPGVADPGQKLIYLAQEMNATVRPLVGPSSILLALMASGMNGQHFQFVGYLPIEPGDRVRKINSLETKSKQDNVTQIFIETPYRNNQLMEFLVKNCHPSTKVCVAVDLTADTELVRTKTVQQWKTEKLELHKRPAIFLLYAGE